MLQSVMMLVLQKEVVYRGHWVAEMSDYGGYLYSLCRVYLVNKLSLGFSAN